MPCGLLEEAFSGSAVSGCDFNNINTQITLLKAQTADATAVSTVMVGSTSDSSESAVRRRRFFRLRGCDDATTCEDTGSWEDGSTWAGTAVTGAVGVATDGAEANRL